MKVKWLMVIVAARWPE